MPLCDPIKEISLGRPAAVSFESPAAGTSTQDALSQNHLRWKPIWATKNRSPGGRVLTEVSKDRPPPLGPAVSSPPESSLVGLLFDATIVITMLWSLTTQIHGGIRLVNRFKAPKAPCPRSVCLAQTPYIWLHTLSARSAPEIVSFSRVSSPNVGSGSGRSMALTRPSTKVRIRTTVNPSKTYRCLRRIHGVHKA